MECITGDANEVRGRTQNATARCTIAGRRLDALRRTQVETKGCAGGNLVRQRPSRGIKDDDGTRNPRINAKRARLVSGARSRLRVVVRELPSGYRTCG